MQEKAKPKVEFTVHVDEAGTLSTLIDKEQKYIINSLKVVGLINGDDIRLLRQMLGANEYNTSEKGQLSTLDLSDSEIVEGGDYYYRYNKTSDNNIGTYMFYHCINLQTLILPNNIASIEAHAFLDCKNLTSINIPNTVAEIGEGAFKNTKIQSIDLPEGISVIRFATFYGCKELKDVYFPSSIKTISKFSFCGCASLSEINFPNGLIEIASRAFARTNLSEIVLPSTLVRLDGFSECQNLTKIEVPKSVKRIGETAFSKCENLTSVTLSEGLETLYGFDNCIGLTNIEIPNSVDTLSAFSGCVNLQTIKVPENVTYLGGFYSCTSLKEINIPKNVKVIGNNAFYGCKNIKSFELPEGLEVIGSYAFYECWPLNFNIPNSVKEIGDGAFWGFGSWSTKGFSFTCKLETVKSSTFEYSKGLESVIFTEKTKSITGRAFYLCQTLKSVTFNDEIMEIGESAFSDCSQLDTITPIPGKIGYLSAGAFRNTSMRTIVLSEGIHTIMPLAFENCSEIRRVNLPKSLTYIYKRAFYGCTKLVEVYCDALTPPVISDSSVFEKIDKTKCKLFVPKDCAKAYKSAAHWKEFTNIIEM